MCHCRSSSSNSNNNKISSQQGRQKRRKMNTKTTSATVTTVTSTTRCTCSITDTINTTVQSTLDVLLYNQDALKMTCMQTLICNPFMTSDMIQYIVSILSNCSIFLQNQLEQRQQQRQGVEENDEQQDVFIIKKICHNFYTTLKKERLLLLELYLKLHHLSHLNQQSDSSSSTSLLSISDKITIDSLLQSEKIMKSLQWKHLDCILAIQSLHFIGNSGQTNDDIHEEEEKEDGKEGQHQDEVENTTSSKKKNSNTANTVSCVKPFMTAAMIPHCTLEIVYHLACNNVGCDF